MAGEERAQEVWLKNRSRFAALNGVDAQAAVTQGNVVVNVSTALPKGAFDIIDTIEEPAGELEAGVAG